jgi:hypothetical protein
VSQRLYNPDIPDLGPDRLDRASEFVSWWLYGNLPRFYVSVSVVEVAARLKRDAAAGAADLVPRHAALPRRVGRKAGEHRRTGAARRRAAAGGDRGAWRMKSSIGNGTDRDDRRGPAVSAGLG